MGAAASWLIPAGLSLVGGIIGNNQASHTAQQAQQGAQQDAQAQTGLDQQAMNLYQSLAQQYQQQYSPLVGPLSQSYGALGAGAGQALPGSFSTYENYLQHPQYTLGGLGGFGSENLAFLQQQMQQGIDPKTIAMMQGNIAHTGAGEINSLENAFGSGLSNPTGFAGDIANKTLEASAGMGAQIAGADQQFQDVASQGLQSLASGIDANTLASLAAAYNLPTSALGNIDSFIQQGRQYLPGAASGITGIAQQYANAGGQMQQNAQQAAQGFTNPFTSLGGFLAGNQAFQNWINPPKQTPYTPGP